MRKVNPFGGYHLRQSVAYGFLKSDQAGIKCLNTLTRQFMVYFEVVVTSPLSQPPRIYFEANLLVALNYASKLFHQNKITR